MLEALQVAGQLDAVHLRHAHVEPRAEPSVVSIELYLEDEHVHAVLHNPYRDGGSTAGNRMALANIRERLQLHFDAEATLTTKAAHGAYQVHIVMPYIKSGDE